MSIKLASHYKSNFLLSYINFRDQINNLLKDDKIQLCNRLRGGDSTKIDAEIYGQYFSKQKCL